MFSQIIALNDFATVYVNQFMYRYSFENVCDKCMTYVDFFLFNDIHCLHL